MPKKYAKRAKESARLQAKLAAQAGPAPDQKSAAARPRHKRRRLTDGLIGMSSAAILTIYGLGYFHTQDANGAFGTQTDPVPTATVASHGPQVLHPTPTLLPGTYRDGTYKATGTSRHGDIEATVVIANGRITSAKVSDCGTRYPCSDVNPLVDEVVSIQAAPRHYMSGATDSSWAYTQAIKSALAQAS
jgi:uncharacterized protein with FMN-binding domain